MNGTLTGMTTLGLGVMAMNGYSTLFRTGAWPLDPMVSYPEHYTRVGKKFIGWPRYSHGMWSNEVYFST